MSDTKNVETIIDSIESSLEERTGKDRRKNSVSEPFLNPDLERRKGDRRSSETEEQDVE